MNLPPPIQQSLDATKVEYVQLGTSGLRVSVPILGGMSLGSSDWDTWVLNEAESLQILKAAFDRGVTTWDTANMYSNGVSEEIFGKAIKEFKIPREKLVLMTKIIMPVSDVPGIPMHYFAAQVGQSKDFVNQSGLSRIAIFSAVDACLGRLGTTYIDVLQIHRFDPTTPIEETMKALHDLVESGKVRYIGASSMWATQFAQMQFVAEKHGWTKFISMQNCYSLCYREEEREMNRFCNTTGVGLIPWSPLYGGKLARALGVNDSIRAQHPHPMDKGLTPEDKQIIQRVEELAEKKGWKMTHVALAWLRSKGTTPTVGFNSVARIDEACEVRGKTLSADEILYLEEPYVSKAIVGHF